MEDHLFKIYGSIRDGDAPGAQAGVKAALAEGLGPEKILKEGLIAAMAEVGRLFEQGEYFVPEMLVSARAMQTSLAILKPELVASGAKPTGKIVLGTVKGDLHDIGKNLVAMMLEGAGFEVVDLGTDVTPEKFVQAIKDHQPALVGMSALLTTTMPSMNTTLRAIETAGLRSQVKVIVGGAPLTEQFAKSIGADGYSPDASTAARTAKALIGAS